MKTKRKKRLIDFLKEKLSELLRDKSIVVWYDPEGSFKNIISSLNLKNTKIVIFQGSYLQIRTKIEETDPALKRHWLIYVPEPPPKPSWLRDYELAGSCLILSLPELLQEKRPLLFTASFRKLLSGKKGQLLVSRWDELIGSLEASEEKIIEALILSAFELPAGLGPGKVISTYLEDPKSSNEKLSRYELDSIFRQYLQEPLGLLNLQDNDEISFRLAGALFLSELVEWGGVIDESFKDALPSLEHCKKWGAWLREWAKEKSPAFYNWASKVDQAYSIEDKITGWKIADTLGLPSVDRVLIKQIGSLLKDNKFSSYMDLIKDIAQKRKNSPWNGWAKEKGNPLPWEGLLYACEVLKSAEEILQELKEKAQWGLEDLFESYAQKWWKTDSAYLKLEARWSLLKGDLQIFAQKAAGAYREYLDLLGQKTADALEKTDKWEVSGWKSQTEVIKELIRPEDTDFALILVDALRIDLARKLKDMLKDEAEVEEIPTLASIPSITPVGMGVMIPIESAISVESVKGKLICKMDGNELNNLRVRTRLWQKLYPKLEILTLDDALEKEMERPVLILSHEIDKEGESIKELKADTFDYVLKQIFSVVQRLLKKGFSKVIIASDHGFLWLPRGGIPSIISGISYSSDVVLERRFALGMIPNVEGIIRIPIFNVGFQGKGELAFPRGLSIFSQPGSISPFLHGGFFPQETALLTLVVKPHAIPLQIKITGPDKIDSFIVRFTLFSYGISKSKAVRVQVVIFTKDGKELGHSEEIKFKKPKEEIKTKPIHLESLGREKVIVKVVDLDIPYKIHHEKELDIVLPERY